MLYFTVTNLVDNTQSGRYRTLSAAAAAAEDCLTRCGIFTVLRTMSELSTEYRTPERVPLYRAEVLRPAPKVDKPRPLMKFMGRPSQCGWFTCTNDKVLDLEAMALRHPAVRNGHYLVYVDRDHNILLEKAMPNVDEELNYALSQMSGGRRSRPSINYYKFERQVAMAVVEDVMPENCVVIYIVHCTDGNYIIRSRRYTEATKRQPMYLSTVAAAKREAGYAVLREIAAEQAEKTRKPSRRKNATAD